MEFELDWLKQWSLYRPHEIALIDGDSDQSTSISYENLYSGSKKLAHWISLKYQIKPGDRVALLAQNHVNSIFLYFALSRLGAALVPINFRLASKEVGYIIKNCGANLIVIESEFEDKLSSLQTKSLGSPIEDSPLVTYLHDFDSIIDGHSPEFDGFLSQPKDAAMILYTSGTTGFPKGAMISHSALFWNSVNTTLRLNLTESDRAVIFLPLFHTGGWNVLTTPLLHRGAQIILLKKFSAERVLELNEKFNCTILFGVPTTMNLIASLSDFKEANLRSLRYAIVGGEPMPIELIKIWEKKGIPIRQGYGLTEFGPNVFSLNEKDSVKKIGSIGFPNFYIQAKVVDDQGVEVTTDQIGELALRGPVCMTGYWNNSEATSETIRDGWLYTGDLVKKDKDGYYYVVGRKKDMFISGGENVYPSEVEQVISELPEIIEVAVVGIADSKWGEVGKAFLVSKKILNNEERSNLEKKVLQHCLESLAKFKVPKFIEWRDSLPKGDSGKILKRELRPSP